MKFAFSARRGKTRSAQTFESGRGEQPPGPGPAPVQHEAALVPAALEHTHAQHLAAELLRAVQPEPGDGLLLQAPTWHTQVPEDIQRVVTAPCTAHGAADAAAMINTWRRDLPRPVLLIVRDSPLPPPELAARRIQALASRCALSLELPHLPQVRLFDTPADALQVKGRAARRVHRRLQQLRRRLYEAAAFLAYTAPVGIPEPLDMDSGPEVSEALSPGTIPTPVS